MESPYGIPACIAEHPQVRGNIIVASVTGSRLYGIANHNSDYDYIIVSPTATKNSRITSGEIDASVWTPETYLDLLYRGTPQAYEINRSPYAVWDSQWEPFFHAIHPDAHWLRRKFLSLKNTQGVEKQRKHAARTAIMALKICAHGTAPSPVLTPLESSAVLACATHPTWAQRLHDMAESTMVGENRLDRLDAMLRYMANATIHHQDLQRKDPQQ